MNRNIDFHFIIRPYTQKGLKHEKWEIHQNQKKWKKVKMKNHQNQKKWKMWNEQKKVSKNEVPPKWSKCHEIGQNRHFAKSEPPGPAFFQSLGVPRDPILRPKMTWGGSDGEFWHHFLHFRVLHFITFCVFAFCHFLWFSCFYDFCDFDDFLILMIFCHFLLLTSILIIFWH